MVVTVQEDNSMYMLIDVNNTTNESGWKKIGSDGEFLPLSGGRMNDDAAITIYERPTGPLVGRTEIDAFAVSLIENTNDENATEINSTIISTSGVSINGGSL